MNRIKIKNLVAKDSTFAKKIGKTVLLIYKNKLNME